MDVAQPDSAADANLTLPQAVRVEWYAPDRPVNGTVFVRSEHSPAELTPDRLER